MPFSGMIDGNAPPFIMLALAMGFYGVLVRIMMDFASIHRGLELRNIARRIIMIAMILNIVLIYVSLYRIVNNWNYNAGKILAEHNIVSINLTDQYILGMFYSILLILIIMSILLYIYSRRYYHLTRGELSQPPEL